MNVFYEGKQEATRQWGEGIPIVSFPPFPVQWTNPMAKLVITF